MKGTKNNMKFKQNMYIYIHIKRYMDNPVNMNVNLNRHMDLNVNISWTALGEGILYFSVLWNLGKNL